MKISGLIPNELGCSTGVSATLTAGTPAPAFNTFAAIPDMIGRACNHMVGLVLSLGYTLTQSGGTGTSLFSDNEIRAVVDSLKWEGTDIGDVMEQSNWRGAVVPFAAYVGAGYSWPGLLPGKTPAANAAYARFLDIFIPVPAFHCGNPLDSVQPVRFFQNSRFTVNVAAAAILTAMSTGATLSAMTARLTALTVPLKKIRLGTPFAMREYVKTAVASGPFSFDGVGMKGGLDGVEPGSGMAAGYLETTANGLTGAFAAANLSQLGVPFRGIKQTTNLASFIVAAMQAQGLRGVYGANQDINTSGAIYAENGPHPYILGSDRNQSALWNSDLGVCPIGIDPSFDMNLSNLQHFPGGAFEIQPTISSVSGDHRMFTHEAKRFTAAKRESLIAVLRDTGRGPDIAAQVLGANARGYFWKEAPHTPRGIGAGTGAQVFAPKLTAQEARYLPFDLAAA